jgi:predicted PolB exonuclease-like 3'-5' exonuclease
MTMKLEEFLTLTQWDNSVMHYVGSFNHLAQYASDHVNFDHKKKACFMRGLNSKIRTMMTSCLNATYHEAVNIAIASEEECHKHKEGKKKNVSSKFSGSNQKRQKIVYHPVNQPRPPYHPPQFQNWQHAFVRPPAALPYPR